MFQFHSPIKLDLDKTCQIFSLKELGPASYLVRQTVDGWPDVLLARLSHLEQVRVSGDTACDTGRQMAQDLTGAPACPEFHLFPFLLLLLAAAAVASNSFSFFKVARALKEKRMTSTDD